MDLAAPPPPGCDSRKAAISPILYLMVVPLIRRNGQPMFNRRSFCSTFTLHPRMAPYTCSSTHAHGTAGTCVRSTGRGTLLISSPPLGQFPPANLLLAFQQSRAWFRSRTTSWEQLLAETLHNESERDAMPNLDIDKAVAQLTELIEKMFEFTLQRKVGVAGLDARFSLRSQFDLLNNLGFSFAAGFTITNRDLFNTAETQLLNSFHELELDWVQ